jgi:hypothetical protein
VVQVAAGVLLLHRVQPWLRQQLLHLKRQQLRLL